MNFFISTRFPLWLVLTALLFATACSKDSSSRPSYFMTADINQMAWSVPSGSAAAQLDYDHLIQEHHLSVHSQTDAVLANGVRYQLSFMLTYPPRTGKYFFNNTGASIPNPNGASGMVSGWRRNGSDDYFTSFSTSGYVEITKLTQDYVEGNFQYSAVDVPGSQGTTIQVENGRFRVPITLVTGKRWEGPH
jgi:hypothetical protein